MKRFEIACLGLAATLGAVAPLRSAIPVVRTIHGGRLTIDVADDTSFQVRDSHVPDTVLFEPQSLYCGPQTTGDTGTLVRIGTSTYAPGFASHPCGSYVSQPFTPWTPDSISAVAGTGSEEDPFTVVVAVVAGATGLKLTETITHVSGSNEFLPTLRFTNAGPAALTFDTFFATDMFLGIQYVFPILRYGRPGGMSAEKVGAPTPACAPHRYYALLPIADRYVGIEAPAMWNEIVSGSLSETMLSGCSYGGVATQWTARTLDPGQSMTISTTSVSFNEGDPFDPAAVPSLSGSGLALLALALGGIGFFFSLERRF